ATADGGHHAVDLSDDRVELVHHAVDDVLDLQNLPPDVYRDLLRQVTVGDRRGHLRHVAQLDGQIAGHRVDVVGQVLPRAGDALDLGLPAKLALRPDLARHPRHLRRFPTRLSSDLVDDVLDLENLAPDVYGDLLRQVAVGDRRGHLRHVAQLDGQIAGH